MFRRSIYSLLIFSLVLISLFFVSPVQAESTCIGEGYEKGDGFFDCTLNGYEWIAGPSSSNPGGYGQDACGDANYQMDPYCSGRTDTAEQSLPCGEGVTFCCMSCIPVNSNATLERGEACGADVSSECGTGLTCADNICVYDTPIVRFGSSCYHSIECASGTPVNVLETLVCREGICNVVEGRYCDDDHPCPETTADSISQCVNNLCQTKPVIITPDEYPVEGIPFDYCSQLPDDPDVEDDFSDPSTQRGACTVCVGSKGPEESGKIFTALGCIDVSYGGLASDLIRLLVGISGGVALLTILAATFLLTISQGDSNKVKQAKEMITSAVVGLFFLIFSIFILEFIGISVLRIPGLSDGVTRESGSLVNYSPGHDNVFMARLEDTPISCSQDGGCNVARLL